ncbi:amino acid permease [Pyxidicoccus fallax]|uniref:Amino acid permease n=1 Tax=Pyxidicoccus fallax TaxID=394095 RepID=A0A848LYV1_9BACT|nr:amino acid permease [Pyxidicoccus fallax]NMO23265.1 amino acid permease [Pyxidicoccus fallax]NPC86116.1 amino acid permease [Pyxidicoccus fallax]
MSSTTATVSHDLSSAPGQTQPLRRTLGLWQGVSLYVGSVLGTGVLVLPGVAAETAGPASVLAWLGLVLLSLPLALTYAALSRQRADAAGFSDAIERAFGPRWGAVAGWLFLAQVPMGMAVGALIAGEYGASVLGGGEVMVFTLGTALVVAAYALNFVGLRVSATAQLMTLGVIVVGLVLIVGSALQDVQVQAFTPFFSRGPVTVGLAAVQLFWAFVGWEAITPLAKEFREPRDIWRASMLAVGIVAAVYLPLAIVTIGTGAYGAATGAKAPLVVLAGHVFGPNASRVVGIAGLLLSFIPMNAYVAGTSRLTFALGERRQLPSWLGVTSASGTPHRALAALGAAALLGLAATYLGRLRIADLLPFSTSSFLATYVLSMAAASKLLRPPLSYAALLSLVACTAVLFFVGTFLAWVAAVTVCALAYQQLVSRRRAD